MRRVLGIRGDFASSAFVGIGGGRSDTHALRGRKAGGHARMQRAKSFSCPQLLISQPSAAALPPVAAISAMPEQSSSSTASTSLSSSPTTTITSATPMSAVLPRRVLARLPGKQKKKQQQQRKFGFVYPDRCDLFSAAPEVCPMLSRGGMAPDTHL